MNNNIFAVLAKYKKPEDYWTAALLYVLKSLWGENQDSKERAACANFLFNLCDLNFHVNEKISFDTQRTQKGIEKKDRSRLDVQISSNDKCVWIEVKDEARLSKEQMDKYQRQLSELRYPKENKKLVLLRRFYGDWQEADKADIKKYWLEVYDWLEDLKAEAELSVDTRNGYLIKEFLSFLQSKGVRIVSEIDKDALQSGLTNIKNFTAMLKQVVQQLGFTLKKEEYWPEEVGDYVGVKFDLNLKDNSRREDFIGKALQRGKYFARIYADDPSHLWMEMSGKDVKIDARKLKEKEMSKNPDWEITWGEKNREDDYIAHSASLETVLSSSDKRVQIDNLGIVFKSMFEALKEVQIHRRGPR